MKAFYGDSSEDTGPGPVVSRWRLRTALRRLREQHQVTQEDAARKLGWSVSKMIRIERGISKLSVQDVQALIRLYGLKNADEVARMLEWARRGRRRDWWVDYKKKIPGSYSGYIGLETEAVAVSSFENIVIPGLLQTSGYIRETHKVNSYALDQTIQQTRTDLRLSRQRQVLNRPDRPVLRVVLDEAVLHRTAGNAELVHDQLRHLAAITQEPNVNLRVLPFSAGLHPSLAGGFTLLEFDNGDGVVSIESSLGSSLLEDTDTFRFYQQTFDHLLNMSLNENDTLHKINEMIGKASCMA